MGCIVLYLKFQYSSKFKILLDLCFNIPRVPPPLTVPLDTFAFHHCSQHSFYCGRADIRQYLANVGFGNGSKAIQCSGFNAGLFFCNFLSMDNSEAFIKFLIAHIKCRKKILCKRKTVVLILCPAFGRLSQVFIVISFIVVDLFLKRNVFSSVMTVLSNKSNDSSRDILPLPSRNG